jgi:hypothetical protein
MRLRHRGGVPKWTMHLEPLLHNGLDILLPVVSGWAVPVESDTWETRQRGGGCNVVADISALRRNQGLLYRFPSTCVLIRPNSTAVFRSIIPLAVRSTNGSHNISRPERQQQQQGKNSFEATTNGKAIAGNRASTAKNLRWGRWGAQSKPNSKKFSTPSSGWIFLGQLLLRACIRRGLALV